MKFIRTDFLSGHAYELNPSDEQTRKRIIGLIPAYLHDRRVGTVIYDEFNEGEFKVSDTLVVVRPDGDRYYLILTHIDGKNMAFLALCVLGGGAKPILVSVRLDDKVYFNKGSLFEGYLSDNGTFCVTDMFIHSGDDLKMVIRPWRTFATIMAIQGHYCPHDDDLIKLKPIQYQEQTETLVEHLVHHDDIVLYKNDLTLAAECKVGFPVMMSSMCK